MSLKALPQNVTDLALQAYSLLPRESSLTKKQAQDLLDSLKKIQTAVATLFGHAKEQSDENAAKQLLEALFFAIVPLSLILKQEKANAYRLPPDTLFLLSYFTNSSRQLKEDFSLGEGSYGEVVYRKFENRSYAVKSANTENLQKSQVALASEALTFMELPSSPYLVSCLGFDGSSLFLEYIPGKSLYELLWNQTTCKWSFKETWICFNSIANGASYLHKHGIAHHDLSPANIMLNFPSLQAKIIDLGHAKDAKESVLITKLKKEYRAPEIREIKEGQVLVETANDCWTIGVIFFQVLLDLYYPPNTSQCTYLQETTFDELYQPLASALKRRVDRKDFKNHSLTKLVCRALHGNPKERISTDALAEALGKLSLGP